MTAPKDYCLDPMLEDWYIQCDEPPGYRPVRNSQELRDSGKDKVIKKTRIDRSGEEITVSTIFLRLDHQYGDGPPVLYETMVFGGKMDGHQDRYFTRDEALEGHERVLAEVYNEENKKV